METQSRFAEMGRLQAEFNCMVDAQWKLAGFRWYRAIWVECAELMDHAPWKWWKGPPAEDKAQAQLELVDIFHFLLSWSLERDGSVIALAEVFAQVGDHSLPAGYSDDVRSRCIEGIAEAALRRDYAATVAAFVRACRVFEVTAETLHKMYVGKNALNRHRNARGYMQGSYIKMWDGRQDNAHLAEIMDRGVLDLDEVVAALNARYDAFEKGIAQWIGIDKEAHR